jgi:hypothetical protein
VCFTFVVYISWASGNRKSVRPRYPRIMDEPESFEDLLRPDELTLRFTPLGFDKSNIPSGAKMRTASWRLRGGMQSHVFSR